MIESIKNPSIMMETDTQTLVLHLRKWLNNNHLVTHIIYKLNDNPRNMQHYQIHITADPELAKDFMLMSAIKSQCKPLEVEFSSNYIP